jgi:hypothetical protein
MRTALGALPTLTPGSEEGTVRVAHSTPIAPASTKTITKPISQRRKTHRTLQKTVSPSLTLSFFGFRQAIGDNKNDRTSPGL